jgi:seryl-tRNA synthetase
MAEVVLEALMKGNVHVRQAAANLTLEERMFNKILKALVKKAGLDEGSTIDALASKLGKPVESINKAIEAKAAKDAEVQRQINALKLDIPDIEF